MKSINVPRFENYYQILDLRDKLSLVDEIVLDFSNVGFAYPDGMVLLSRIISDAVRRGVNIIPSGYSSASYPRNMGFFTACGFDIQPLANAPGNANYFPLRSYRSAELVEKAEAYRQHPGQIIQSMSEDLAKIMIRGRGSEMEETISYSIREIVRNIVEHSGSEDFYVAGQFYPTRGNVEIAIMDRGIGIRAGLQGNPHLSLDDDYQAILKSMVPGISGTFYTGMPESKKTHWSNSGFGLFLTSQICRMGGRFSIGSGDCIVLMSPNDKQVHPFGFPGTFIGMEIKISALPRLIGLLKVLTERGERAAKIVKVEADVEASYASKFLMETS